MGSVCLFVGGFRESFSIVDTPSVVCLIGDFFIPSCLNTCHSGVSAACREGVCQTESVDMCLL